jgi:prolipoprotein diacylglyceryltransferase
MRQIIVDFGTINPLGMHLSLRIYGYGLMLVFGFLLGIHLARWRARRSGEDPEVVTHLGLLSLVGGILGARIGYVVEQWHRQFADAPNKLSAILDVTSGGLIYYWGVILATALALVYLFLRRLPVRRYFDILAPSLMVGLAFGRAGCLLNGCCYGAQCGDHWPLGMKFPMFSKPLLKIGGGENPFSAGTEGPSPAYAHQFEANQVSPDPRLVNSFSGWRAEKSGGGGRNGTLHLPRDLHGRLMNDQLAVMSSDRQQARQRFDALAGKGGRVGYEEWRAGLSNTDGFLRGSESWDEAILFDQDRDGTLDFEEAWNYLTERRLKLLKQFDADGDGKLDEREQARANAYLQEDLFACAGREWSRPVKPAQVLAILNALLLAGLLTGFYRLRRREGQVFALLSILYPIARFVEESIRDDNPHNLLKGVLTHNQYTSMVILSIGVIMWAVLRRFPASAGAAWSQRRSEARLARLSRRSRKP